MSRSVPAVLTRSVPAVVSRSVPAVKSRSVPTVESRSVPTVESRSVPAVESRSVPTIESRLVPAIESRSVHTERFRSVYTQSSRSVPREMRGDDEVILSKKEDSDLKDKNNNDKHEIGEVFRIKTNLFDYETLLCVKFSKFSYLLKVDPELFTHNIQRTETYEDYEYKLDNEVDEPWSKDRVPYEMCDHIYEPFLFKDGKAKRPTYNSNEDGFCNGGELPRMV
nr:hypothetical protein [Tanacetum cinerariifolium]